MYGIIYKVTNKENNKVYIGQTIQTLSERKSKHYYKAKQENDYNTHFINALRKYSEKSFNWEIIDEAENQEDLDKKEKYWIHFYNSIEQGYNTKDGGEVIIVTDKFLEKCGSHPFYAFDLKGNKIGEFLNQREFAREHNMSKGDIYRMLQNQLYYSNGIICIDKETFTQERLDECIKVAEGKTTPFIARNIETGEVFGPFTNKTKCKEFLNLKSNHIREVLDKKRKTQEGYTFQYCKEGE
jgi:hypothetical protein